METRETPDDWSGLPDARGETRNVPKLLVRASDRSPRRRAKAFERLEMNVVPQCTLSEASPAVVQWLLTSNVDLSAGCEEEMALLVDAFRMGMEVAAEVSPLDDPGGQQQRAGERIRTLLTGHFARAESFVRADRVASSAAWLELLAEAEWNEKVEALADWAAGEPDSSDLRVRAFLLVTRHSRHLNQRARLIAAAQASGLPTLRYYGMLFSQQLPESCRIPDLLSAYEELPTDERDSEPYYVTVSQLPVMKRSAALELIARWQGPGVMPIRDQAWAQVAARVVFDDRRTNWPDSILVDPKKPHEAYGRLGAGNWKPLDQFSTEERRALRNVIQDPALWASMPGLWAAFALPANHQEALRATETIE